MFNPHIHQQQQQQQQFHQHLRQLQQLFQQQQPPTQPPPAHHVAHHLQTPRAAPPRMVSMCQTTQTTLVAPNPMLQSAILMQQMQGNMRGFGMGGQQYRQFFPTGARSSLLGPVPMGMALKSPIMGFPAARPFHPHTRFFNATTSSTSSISTTDAASRHADRKRDSEQMTAGSFSNQPAAAANSTNEAADKTPTDDAVEGENTQISEEQNEEPVTKRQKTEGSEEPIEEHVVEVVSAAESDSKTVNNESEGSIIQEDGCFSSVVEDLGMEENKADDSYRNLSAQSPSGKLSEDNEQVNLPAEEAAQDKDDSKAFPESQDEEEASDGSNKFYCYLCSITCHNQQNFRSHMNSISHQQRMMEIQHMSNACLVSLLPRVQESLQGASKDGAPGREKKADLKQWCANCHAHFTCATGDHQRSEEHKLASKTDLSFCSVCQKRFKTSQQFLGHLQSQEHKQKIQEKGCETLAKLTSIGTDGFSFEVEAEELQKDEGEQGSTQDGWSCAKEVTLNDITSDQQYDPDTVYGSSFLDPVAGFICRLCNRFYLFESSALDSHCKSLQHFENLKSYKAMVAEKSDDVQASTKSLPPAGNTRPAKETECSQENVLTTATSETTDLNSTKSNISVTTLKTPEEHKYEEREMEASSTSLDFTLSATGNENPDQELSSDHAQRGTASRVSATEESQADVTAVCRDEAYLKPAVAAENSNGEEQETTAGPGKKKGKNTAKRRSGRGASRR